MTDIFLKKYKKYSDSELLRILSNNHQYQNDAVYAALLELENRNVDVTTHKELKQQIEQQINIDKASTTNNDSDLISNKIIWLIGFLLNPLLAAIPYIMNLYAMKNSKYIFEVVAFILAYTILTLCIINLFEIQFGVILIINALGSTILTELFWRRHSRTTERNAR